MSKFKRTCGGGTEGRGCGSNHLGHELWCQGAKICFSTQIETVLRSEEEDADGVLLQVMRIPSISSVKDSDVVLWDTACTGKFVRNGHAREMKFPYREKQLRVVTLGGQVQEINGLIYDCQIKDQQGKIHKFTAHGLDQVTGALGRSLSKNIMKQLFPNVIGAHALSVDAEVDYLIGLEKASWQPERIEKAAGGGDFWIWGNSFGTCVGGSHPLVNSFTTRSNSLYTVLKTITQEDPFVISQKIPTCTAMSVKVSEVDNGDFFHTEQLGTVVEPRCGNCRCGRCPVPGSRYSFREESELKIIEENLSYDEDQKCWVARYPLMFPRELLKGSRDIAFKSMLQTEKSLRKNDEWGAIYQSQILDMIARGVARVVSDEELEAFSGHVNYIPHLAAINPRSQSTPVRICFDASRQQGGGPSLNQVLAKGPDRYLNNLAGVIVNFRNGREAAKGDVRKMYNCVKLDRDDAFLQCFLWRNLDSSQQPQTFQVLVNNIGALCLQKSADVFEETFPVTATQIKRKSYVDDLGITGRNKQEVCQRTKEAPKYDKI